MMTEQQRAELERREWRLEIECGEFQTWGKTTGKCAATLYADGFFTFSGDPMLAAEFLAVAGYQPSGYRLVQEEVAERALPHVRGLHQRLAVSRDRLAVALSSNSPAHAVCREIEEAAAVVAALASALQGRRGCDWRELAQDIQAALDGETSPDPLIEENRRLRRLVDHYETGIRRLIEEVSRHDTGAAAGVRGDP